MRFVETDSLTFEQRMERIKERHERFVKKQQDDLERIKLKEQREKTARVVKPDVDINGRYKWPFPKMEVNETVIFEQIDFSIDLKTIQIRASTYGKLCGKKFSTYSVDDRLFVTRIA